MNTAGRWYRRLTIVRAVQWTGDNLDGLAAFGAVWQHATWDGAGADTVQVWVSRIREWVTLNPGDWLVVDRKGEGFAVYSEDAFVGFVPVEAP